MRRAHESLRACEALQAVCNALTPQIRRIAMKGNKVLAGRTSAAKYEDGCCTFDLYPLGERAERDTYHIKAYEDLGRMCSERIVENSLCALSGDLCDDDETVIAMRLVSMSQTELKQLEEKVKGK